MKPTLLHTWADYTPAQVFDAFAERRYDEDADKEVVIPIYERGIELLLASYCHEDYSGKAFLLFRRDGKLWELNAHHCSCYGLEGKWDPEVTTVVALRHRLGHGTLGLDDGGWDDDGNPTPGANVFAAALRNVLAALDQGGEP